jgi:hypothetical protein
MTVAVAIGMAAIEPVDHDWGHRWHGGDCVARVVWC